MDSERKRPDGERNAKMEDAGFIYVKDRPLKSDPEILAWVCERKRDCRGRIHVKNGEVIANITVHSHGPDLSRVNALKTVKAVRDRAASTQESTQQILGRIKENISEGTAAALPSQPSLKRMIQRQRNWNDRPPLPVNLY